MLKQYPICVIPDIKIQHYDRLPQFTIIETSLRNKNNKQAKNNEGMLDTRNIGEQKKKKRPVFDAKQFKGNIELFQHINDMQQQKLRVEQSESLKVRKRRRGG